MSFGAIYAYRTNSRNVVAIAESDEYSAGSDTVVDVVLVGVDNGRRQGVTVAADAEAHVVNTVLATYANGE
jgi:hypothetical protein